MNQPLHPGATNSKQGTEILRDRMALLLRPNVGSTLSNSGALVIRLATGLFIAGFHGWAFAATVTQLLGGLAVAAGFLTRLAAFAVAMSLVVAAYSNFLSNKDNQLALLYCLLFAGFTLYGGGRYSVDQRLFG
jgi:hypothetical protein